MRQPLPKSGCPQFYSPSWAGFAMAKCLFAVVFMMLAASLVEAGPIRRHPKPIPGSYIVVLRPEFARAENDRSSGAQTVTGVAQEMLSIHGRGRVKRLYQRAVKGFSVAMTEADASVLADDYRVLFVEEDGIVEINASQTGATWGIDRVDQRDLPLNQTYTYDQTGAGVHAYVLDTGIRATHVEFTGRIGNGYDGIRDGNGTSDCHGHGTHVAGTIGGTKYGVAKAVVLHPVRVLGCTGSGTTSGVVAGIDWVTANHKKPAVANMSLGGGVSAAMDQAVANSVAAGVTYSVAAGNSSADACNYSPARASSALTVGATTSTDAKASYSNFGTCLDLFAPGSSITSASYSTDTGAASMSGTSMAAPHVAGAAALYLQTDPTATPAIVVQALRAQATLDHVSGAGAGSPNYLLYAPFPGGTPADTIRPTTSITSPANGAIVSGTVTLQASASDARGVTRVDFFVDGALRGSDTTAPYTYAWNTIAAVNGAHTLFTRAYDPSNNVGQSASVSVSVNNPADTIRPTTSITSPANGAIVSGTVTLQASASDARGVTRVDFFVDGALKGSDTTAPYTYAWNTTAVVNGAHTLFTRAYDPSNNVGQSASLSVSVNNPADTIRPTTSITSPANGAIVSGTVTLQASASDARGVTRVDFFVDGALKGSDTTAPYTYAWNTTAVVNGAHTLFTRAYDPSNNVGQSVSVSVSVKNPVGSLELVANGGFETGPTPWTFSGFAFRTSGPSAHSGASYALLGNGDRASGSVSQSVTIPATAPATLTFWLSVSSTDQSGSAADVLFVEVVAGANTVTLGTFSNLNQGAYALRSFNLSAWRGQTVRVQFRVSTNQTKPTTFFVDDVSLR